MFSEDPKERYMGVSENCLVGGFNPSENISQMGNLPQIVVKIKNI